ncbi:MAG TPA: Clp protease N-terminal domain-containing protein [Planctomycetota bacterium]|nr:Clp protease N-terminal domain-containing protein [Planctomycetota bacterium]
MFDRFTERAKKVMHTARDEALGLGHGHIGTEHMLLGLVGQGSGVAATVLKAMSIDLEQIRHEVEQLVERGPATHTMSQVPFTPRAKRVLELSLHEAVQLGHDYIGTEHLLLALIGEHEGIAARVSRKVGVEADEFRAKVLDLLDQPNDAPPRFRWPHEERHRTTDPGFDRFSDRAKMVMILAGQAARKLNHGYIGTEHLLLGLVQEGSGVAANVLAAMTVDLAKIRREVERIVKVGPSMVAMGRLPLTPRAKTVLDLSREEASELGHDHIGTEHLLLGLIGENEGIAAQVLLNLGVDLDRVRKQVCEFLGTARERGPRSSGRLATIQRLLRRHAMRHPGRDAEVPTSDPMRVTRGSAFVLLPHNASFDELYGDVIVPALTAAGMQAVHKSGPDSNVLEILGAELLLAVMTGQDRNVLYDLGLCHALRCDPIQLVARGESLPPHLRSSRLLEYDDDQAGRAQLRERLTQSAREYLERVRRRPGS